MLGKKQKFIYWLIGLGCGIALSGIGMAFIGLSISQEEDKQISKTFSANRDDILEGEEEANGEDTKEENIEENIKAEVEEDKLKVPNYKWVEIPLDYGATQISSLLKSEGIIDDQEEFLEYLREHKQTKKLRSGSQYLPINGEYDSILAILTGQLEEPN